VDLAQFDGLPVRDLAIHLSRQLSRHQLSELIGWLALLELGRDKWEFEDAEPEPAARWYHASESP
jgi:hypothetical protein